MSGLETAIRQALERSDRANAETRARIYQSARNALEAGLRKQNVHDETVIAGQRHRLETAIHGIEQQERAALKASAPPVAPPLRQDPVVERTAPAPDRQTEPERQTTGRTADPAESLDDVHARPQGETARDTAPSLDGLRIDRRETRAGVADPVIVPARDRTRPAASGRDAVNDMGLSGADPLVPRRKRRRGRFVSGLMVAAIVIAALGSAVWWVVSTGLLATAPARTAPSSTTASEDFDGGAGLRTLGTAAGFSGDWVEVFQPGQGIAATAGPRATAVIIDDEGGAHLRIVSATGDAEGNVAIEVPVSVLEQMAGRDSTIAVSVHAAMGKPTQFSIECDFSSLGDCGRHRFTVNDERSDMLFKVAFDRSLTPSAPGRILINSDVTGGGGSLDLYAVRLLPGQ